MSVACHLSIVVIPDIITTWGIFENLSEDLEKETASNAKMECKLLLDEEKEH